MKYACQFILVIMWGFWFVSTIRADIRGSPAREPQGETNASLKGPLRGHARCWWFAGPLREFFR